MITLARPGGTAIPYGSPPSGARGAPASSASVIVTPLKPNRGHARVGGDVGPFPILIAPPALLVAVLTGVTVPVWQRGLLAT